MQKNNKHNIGDRVRLKHKPDDEWKIYGISQNGYKLRKIHSKTNWAMYYVQDDDILDQVKDGKDGPPRDQYRFRK